MNEDSTTKIAIVKVLSQYLPDITTDRDISDIADKIADKIIEALDEAYDEEIKKIFGNGENELNT